MCVRYLHGCCTIHMCKYHLLIIYTPVHKDYIDKNRLIVCGGQPIRVGKTLRGLITHIRCASGYDYELIDSFSTHNNITSAQNIFKRLFHIQIDITDARMCVPVLFGQPLGRKLIKLILFIAVLQYVNGVKLSGGVVLRASSTQRNTCVQLAFGLKS